jgi:hypothetical protein
MSQKMSRYQFGSNMTKNPKTCKFGFFVNPIIRKFKICPKLFLKETVFSFLRMKSILLLSDPNLIEDLIKTNFKMLCHGWLEEGRIG